MDIKGKGKSYKSSASEAQSRRVLRVAAVFFLVAIVVAAAGYWLFVGWRARDLALKSRANLQGANYRMAWLQAEAARNLRDYDVEVLRTSAIVDAAFGRKESLESWRLLASSGRLTSDDEEQRARAAIRFGDQQQFDEAVAALDAAGKKDAAARLRSASRLSRGDLEQAIEEARRGASLSDNSRLRLDLARLLLRRYVYDLAASPAAGSAARRAFSEMTAIVDSLQNDPELGPEALAFGLTFLLPGAETQKSWAENAMARMEPGNPALLPAATILVDNKYKSPQALHAELRSVFDAAPLDRRAAYAAWLAQHGLAREALTLVTAQEAAESPKAFLARTEALGQLGNWNAVIGASEAGGNVPESVRLLTRARAEYALRADPVSGAKSVGLALRAAAREQSLPGAVQAADAFGGQNAVSDALVELSGDPAVSGFVFRLARERFAKSGDHSRMQAAFERALRSAPEESSVRDYARYAAMIGQPEEEPDLEGAVRESKSAPADQFVRVTEALAHLRAGQPKQALSIFEDITVFYDRLPPGQQAVICAVLAANGKDCLSMARAIDRTKLAAGEQELINGLR